jgi:thioredoxin reductase
VNSDNTWEAVIVGGGAAGMSAAVTMGRAGRRALLVDAGGQSNLVAERVGGLLGRPDITPQQLYAEGRDDLARFDHLGVRSGAVTSADRTDSEGFVVCLDDGSEHTSGALVLATGADYRHADVAGVAERFGASVFHCPFCHGWEVRGRTLAVLAEGQAGVNHALNLLSWTDDVTLLTNGSELDDTLRSRVSGAGVSVDERPVARVEGPGKDLRSVVFADGEETRADALLVQTSMRMRSTIGRDLGASVIEPSAGLDVETLRVDPLGRTDVPGLYAAGDTALTASPSVSGAMASGYLAATGVVQALAASRNRL